MSESTKEIGRALYKCTWLNSQGDVLYEFLMAMSNDYAAIAKAKDGEPKYNWIAIAKAAKELANAIAWK